MLNLHRSLCMWGFHALRMSPTVNRSSKIQYFEYSDAIKIHNVVLYSGTATSVCLAFMCGYTYMYVYYAGMVYNDVVILPVSYCRVGSDYCGSLCTNRKIL